MDTSNLEAKEKEERDLMYSPDCNMMSVGRPGPETFNNCSEIMMACTRELLVGL